MVKGKKPVGIAGMNPVSGQVNSRLNILVKKEFEPQPAMEVLGVLPEWIERFPREAVFLRKYSENLDRNTVKKVCGLKSKSTLRQKFLLVMLWGYGPYAVGATRTLNITNQPNFEEKICRAYKLAGSGRHIDAIATLAIDPIKGLGPAYGTKFVFFASPWRKVCAPIYDKRVRDWLTVNAKSDFKASNLRKLQWDTNNYVKWSDWLLNQSIKLNTNWWDLEYLIFQDAKSI